MPKTAQLRLLDNAICIGCKEKLMVFSSENGSCLFSYTHSFDTSIMDGNNKPLDQRLEDLCASPNGEYLCAMYSDKVLVIFNTERWTCSKKIKTTRRPTAMTFDPTGSCILVADKSGDLYRYNLEAELSDSDLEESKGGEGPQPILGHVSMLLDVKVTMDGKYILTADRDEKIRVSDFDYPYVIENYCLGHTEFVCSLENVQTDGKGLFLSSSGDGTIRLWDAKAGKECASHTFVYHKLENGDGETKVQIIPSLLSCAPSGNFFAVASNQKEQVMLSLFKIDVEVPSFSNCSDFAVPGCARIMGIIFSQEDVLYVLCVRKNHDQLFLLEVICPNGACSLVENPPAVDPINAHLLDFPIDLSDLWSSLFKIRSDGEAYASYHQKKEDRLAAKAARAALNCRPAKRQKVGD